MGFFGNLFGGSDQRELTKEEMKTKLTEMKSLREQITELQEKYDGLKKEVTPTLKARQKSGTIKFNNKHRGKKWDDMEIDDFLDSDDFLLLVILVDSFCDAYYEPEVGDTYYVDPQEEIINEAAVSPGFSDADDIRESYSEPTSSYSEPSPSYSEPTSSYSSGSSSYDSGGSSSSYDSGGSSDSGGSDY